MVILCPRIRVKKRKPFTALSRFASTLHNFRLRLILCVSRLYPLIVQSLNNISSSEAGLMSERRFLKFKLYLHSDLIFRLLVLQNSSGNQGLKTNI